MDQSAIDVRAGSLSHSVASSGVPWLAITRGLIGVALIATWEIGSRLLPDLVAGPAATSLRLAEIVRSGEILPMLRATVLATLGGLGIGAGLGVVLPFLIQISPRMSAVAEPFARAAVGIPKLALSPILILWFGIGLSSKVVLVALMTFFMVFVATFAGIRSVGPNLIRTVSIFGAGSLEIAREVYLHSAQPFVWAALRAALPWAINAALVGEFLASEEGIGHYIHHSYNVADITGVYAGIVVTVGLVLVADWGLNVLQRRSLQWRPVDAETVLH